MKPLRCADNSGPRGGFFVFSRARLGVVGSPHAEGRKDPPSVASPAPPRNTTGQSTLRYPAHRGLRVMTGVVVAAGRGLGGPPLPPPYLPGESRTGGCNGKSICDPVSSVYRTTRDLPITPAGRMMKPWQQHPLSRESPSSPGNAGDDRAFATCVFGSKTFLKCLLLGRQRIRFLLTTLIWSERTSARASSTPPSISTILSSSDRRMKCGSSSMPSCRHRWHGS